MFTEKQYTVTFFDIFDIITTLGSLLAFFNPIMDRIAPLFILMFLIKLANIIKEMYLHEYRDELIVIIKRHHPKYRTAMNILLKALNIKKKNLNKREKEEEKDFVTKALNMAELNDLFLNQQKTSDLKLLGEHLLTKYKRLMQMVIRATLHTMSNYCVMSSLSARTRMLTKERVRRAEISGIQITNRPMGNWNRCIHIFVRINEHYIVFLICIWFVDTFYQSKLKIWYCGRHCIKSVISLIYCLYPWLTILQANTQQSVN